MNRTRAAILRGEVAAEGPDLPPKRPYRRSRDRSALEDLISRQDPQGEGSTERRRKVLESALAMIADDDRGTSPMPRLSPLDMVMSHAVRRPVTGTEDIPALAATLSGEIVPRRQSRISDGRREERRTDLATWAVIVFRDGKHEVRVLNASPRGLMIEAAFLPNIAERLLVHLDNGTGGTYFVRWIRGGRIGLGRREEDSPDAE